MFRRFLKSSAVSHNVIVVIFYSQETIPVFILGLDGLSSVDLAIHLEWKCFNQGVAATAKELPLVCNILSCWVNV